MKTRLFALLLVPGALLPAADDLKSRVARKLDSDYASLDELKQRIIQGIDEMNAHPVRFQWKTFELDMV